MGKVILASFLLFVLTPAKQCLAQNLLPYSTQGVVYSQNFDGLPGSGSFLLTGKGPHTLSGAPINATNLTGWQFLMINGSNTNAGFLPGTGSSTANGVQSLGAANAVDRALGSLSSGSGIYSIGLILTNTSGILLNSITIRFTAEQWRKGGSGNKNTWSFKYKTGVFSTIDQPDLQEEPNLNFSSVINTTGAGSLNGNLPENQQSISFTLLGINWKNGEQLLLRWDDADEAGNDDACGIDNFSFSAEQVEDVPTIMNKPISNLSTHSVQLNFTVNDNNARTDISVEYDTIVNFSSKKILYPQPDNIIAGTGTTSVIALLNGLAPGIIYYYRVRATNNNGTTIGPVIRFTTPVEPPDIITAIAGMPNLTTAVLGGSIRSDGGSPIIEKGIVWSLNSNPTVSANKISMGSGKDDFSQLVTGLPQGTMIYARAYAINTTGTAYANAISLTTQTTISSFTTISSSVTNAQTVSFLLKTTQAITGLTNASFSLITEGIDSAYIASVTGSGTSFTVNVNTGKGDGTIRIQLTNDTNLLPHIFNKPFTATNYYLIDKLPPVIRKISIPNQMMKIGDTVPVTVSVYPDPATLKMISGSVNSITLSTPSKKNDSTYASYFIINSGANDIEADSAIPVRLIMIDPTGNTSSTYEHPIIQNNDPIDANRPFIIRMQSTTDGIYKAGDTLMFTMVFSEKTDLITSNGLPSFKITIGNITKQATYTNGSGSNSLAFIYIIQTGDEDSIGIKTSSGITQNNSIIKDVVGNNAQLTIPSPVLPAKIIVDGVVPKVSTVSVPADKLYAINDTLVFSVNFSKKVIIVNSNDTPLLKLTIGNSVKNIAYFNGAGTQSLLFRYIVQKNDLDKTGITLTSLLTKAGNTITDINGNPAVLALKNIGSLTNVKVDAVAPVFTKPDTETLAICETDSSISLTDALSVSDEEKGEPLYWKIISAGNLNSLSKTNISALSNGTKLTPGNIIYTPSRQNINTDTLLVSVSDGMNESVKKIIISIQPPVKDNFIGTSQYVCSGNTPAALIGSIPTGGNNIYEYLWEFSSNADSATFSKAGGVNTLKDFSPSKLTATSWFRRKVASGACYGFSDIVKITVLKTGLWTGNFSADWRNAKNWCNAVTPYQSIDVLIPANTIYNPVISDTASCYNMNIQRGGRLTVNGTLQVNGILNAAPELINIQKGKLVAGGTDAQNISAKNFEKRSIKDLVVNNSSGVTLSDTLFLTGSLQLVSGYLQTNGGLTIKQKGNIGASAAGTSISGNVSIEYGMTGVKRQFHLLGHPFSNDIGLYMLSDSININNQSVFRYDVFTGYDSLAIDENWTAFTHTNDVAENAWKKFSGIRLLMIGKPAQELDRESTGNGNNINYASGPVNLKLTGSVNTGDQELTLQKGAYSGYNLVANPYPSPIDLSLVSIGEGVGKNFWVWNTEQDTSGGYSCVPFQSKYILPAFGAFFVKAAGNTNNTIVFTENCKANSSAVELPRITGIEDYHIELRLERDSVFLDRIFLYHSDSARSSFDKYDGEKFINPRINFYSLSREQKKLSVDVRPLTNESTIPLGLQVNEPGTFQIKIAGSVLPLSNTLLLHDRYLNKWIPLEKDSSYCFATTTDTASMGHNRFEITSRREQADTFFSISKIAATIGPVPASNNISVNYTSTGDSNTIFRIINSSGNIIKLIPIGFQKSGQVNIYIGNLLPGIYFVEIKSGNYIISKKIIKL
jgi:hypothetical protein